MADQNSMRCLYCGKELALLKRLRGGGEFCSDAHRQQYQEEYNQLALNRLLQAKPTEETAKEVPTLASLRGEAPIVLEIPEAAPVGLANANGSKNGTPGPPPPEPAPTVTEPPAAPPPVEEIAPAPLASYLAEPRSAPKNGSCSCHVELAYLEKVTRPTLPERASILVDASAIPDPAGKIPWGLAIQPVDASLSPRARSIESREFAFQVKSIESLRGLSRFTLESCQIPLEIVMSPSAPHRAPAPWFAPPLDFAQPVMELGELARLTFGAVRDDGTESAAAKPAVSARTNLVTAPGAHVTVAALAPPQFANLTQSAPLAPQPPATGRMELQAAPPVVIETAAKTPALPEPPAFVEPAPAREPLSLEIEEIAPGKGRPALVFGGALTLPVELQIPQAGAMPLRATMVLGPASSAPAEAPAAQPPAKEALAPVESDAGAKAQRSAVVEKPVAEQKPLPEKPPVKAQSDRGKSHRPRPEPERKPKSIETKPPAANLEHESQHAKPEAPSKPAPEPEPASVPAFAASTDKPLSEPAPSSTDLGLPTLSFESETFWGRLPVVAKIGIAAVIVGSISWIAYTMVGSKASAVPTTVARESIQPGEPITDGTWIADWAPDLARRGRRVSILKSSLPLTDYRIQFEAQIESKAIGWVYRGVDPQNYYVAKIEVVKPGLEPTIALVHFPVVKGQDGLRVETPLNLKVRVDTLYKIRFEAVGSRFTTWINDQKVGEWTDGRFTSGAPGLFVDRGEVPVLKGNVNVTPLVVKKQ